MAGCERLEVYFSGHVQGVGFRQTTRSLAANFDVTGYVRNLGDGRVELVVEGARHDLSRLLEAVESAMSGFIRRADSHWYSASGEFDDFEIRRDGCAS
ncbi:MAG: acylphosphatase [Pirellulales bacterium]